MLKFSVVGRCHLSFFQRPVVDDHGHKNTTLDSEYERSCTVGVDLLAAQSLPHNMQDYERTSRALRETTGGSGLTVPDVGDRVAFSRVL